MLRSSDSQKQTSDYAPAKSSTDKPHDQAALPNLDYGLLIHYGMQTFTGPPTGGPQSEKAATCFAPANLDVKSWAKLAKEGGMNFAVMSIKHSTGFRLWDAPIDDYDVGGSPFKRDLLAEFIESCNAEGLMPGANYIVTDVHREGSYRRNEPVPASHMKLIKDELGDLLTRYPGLRVLAFGHFGRFTPKRQRISGLLSKRTTPNASFSTTGLRAGPISPCPRLKVGSWHPRRRKIQRRRTCSATSKSGAAKACPCCSMWDLREMVKFPLLRGIL